MTENLRYLMAAATAKLRGDSADCPSCRHTGTECVARKHLVTELRRCNRCRLLFRAPTVRADESRRFYQETYSQGFTTEVPDHATLTGLLARGFRGTEKDYSHYLSVLDALGVRPGAKVFDFGSSWGYGTWQLQRHGFDVEAFEISARRAEFARQKLGLSVRHELPEPTRTFDVFFSAHVLEHVPSVSASISYGLAMLKPGGIFVAFTPNGSDPFRRAKPWNWMKAWGLVHPNLLDDRYYKNAWGMHVHLLASSPYSIEEIRRWRVDFRDRTVGDLAGEELCFATVAN